MVVGQLKRAILAGNLSILSMDTSSAESTGPNHVIVMADTHPTGSASAIGPISIGRLFLGRMLNTESEITLLNEQGIDF